MFKHLPLLSPVAKVVTGQIKSSGNTFSEEGIMQVWTKQQENLLVLSTTIDLQCQQYVTFVKLVIMVLRPSGALFNYMVLLSVLALHWD